jgi:glycerol-3-phosphate dehydrogenase
LIKEESAPMRSRTEELQNIAGKSFDLCVIGGGATGSGCALDAQLRGLRTVVLEAGDFAGATSSAATKIIHGGVRYLEEAIKDVDPKEYHVVVRALHERVRMLNNGPHLTRQLQFLVPSYHWLNVAYLDIGLKIYDWLAGSARISPSKYVSREETLERMPELKREGLIGAVEYADGQFDDARYNLALVQTFSKAGGNVLNYARVTKFGRDSAGHLASASVADQLSGKEFSIQAKVFVNATGPLADSIRTLATNSATKRMRLSKGAHILLPLEVFPSKDAMLIPKTDDGRVLFAVPWNGRLLVGTTEQEVAPGEELFVSREDVAFMLGQLNKYLEHPITPSQIVSGFAGARPLVSSGESESTQKLARDDVIEVDSASGLISIMGGKWTTHRAMAEDTINAVQKALSAQVTESPTRSHVLHGGEGFSSELWEKLSATFPISHETAHHLSAKFGTAAWEVLELTKADHNLEQLIVPNRPVIHAEVVYCVRQELAATIEDVVARRLGMQFYSWRDAIAAAPVVGTLMAKELSWSDGDTKSAVASYAGKINHFLEQAGLESEPSSGATAGHASAV